MLKRDWDKKICEEYIKKGDDGDVHCHECPLRLPQIDPYYACMANHHWNNEKEEWVFDERTKS